MNDLESMLTSGREAFERADWSTAYRQFSAVRGHSPLSIDDLGRLSAAAFSCGEMEQTFSSSEEFYNRLLQQGDTVKAAMKALSLSLMWITHGDAVIGSGWLNRARRLLVDEPETVEHGFLLYMDAEFALMAYDVRLAAEAAPELARMSERLGSPALACLGRVLAGMVAVREGRCDEGFAQLDEAMLPVLAGQLDTEWAGDIYCAVIHVCHQLMDLRRMRVWTQATRNWCQQFSEDMTYSGVCQVHQLQLLSFEAGGEGLESELLRSCTAMEGRQPWAAGEAYYQLGNIQRMQGRYREAEEAFARARELGIDPQPGQALLYVATGRAERGWTDLCTALDVPDRLAKARLLLPAVELALRRGFDDEAEQLCIELERIAEQFSSAGFRAWAQHARALILLARGRNEEALKLLRLAARTYSDLRGRYEVATVYELMSDAYRSLGRTQIAAANTNSALEIYRSLGAVPDAARLVPSTGGSGLTPREVEVLSSVADGASNKDVAAALFISEKTVGRHLANIFAKLNVSSRTAAAAWAHEQRRKSDSSLR